MFLLQKFPYLPFEISSSLKSIALHYEKKRELNFKEFLDFNPQIIKKEKTKKYYVTCNYFNAFVVDSYREGRNLLFARREENTKFMVVQVRELRI